jgi:hypothetical protein
VGYEPGKRKLAVIVYRDFGYGLCDGIYTGCKRDAAALVCIISGRNVNRSFVFSVFAAATFFRRSRCRQKGKGLRSGLLQSSPTGSRVVPVTGRGGL